VAGHLWQAIYGHHAYNSLPRHVRSVDVGLIRIRELVGHGECVMGILDSYPVPPMSFAIWITGLPGSGKSVLARAAAETRRARSTRSCS